MRKSNELQIGKAGEYIVCADLIIKGLIAYPSEQGLPYDVLIDAGGRLLKCQVKTTEKPRVVPQRKQSTTAYIFNVKRHGNRNNLRRYTESEVDVFALVELQNRTVGYLLNEEMPTTVNFRVDDLRGSYYDEKGINDYSIVKPLIGTGKTLREISKTTGVNYSTVSRMSKDGYEPFETKARYFSDIYRDKEWFYEIK